MIRNLSKCFDSCLRGFVCMLAIQSYARAYGPRNDDAWNNVNGVVDDTPVTLIPLQWSFLMIPEDKWRPNMTVPNANCTLSTTYEGANGVESYVTAHPFYCDVNHYEAVNGGTVVKKNRPSTFFCKSTKIPTDGYGRVFPQIQVTNDGCSVVQDRDVCKKALKHNGPEITVKCKLD